MTMTQAGLLALILHLAVCAVFLLLMRRGVLRVGAYTAPFLVLVPFWGCLCVLVLHVHLRTHEEAAAAIPLEKLRIEDDIYKSLSLETSQDKDVAPLEEVLLLSPARTRRKLMLDILSDEPERYTGVLQTARGGDDTEVVHYAVTAMSEMSKQQDLLMQQYENARTAHPEDLETVRDYARFLEDYIARGFAKGRAEKIQRGTLTGLLEILWEKEPLVENGSRLARQLLAQEHYARAEEILQEMQGRFPDREEPYLLMVECLALQGRGRELHACIRAARENNVYFSSQGETRLKFWEQGEGRADA